MCDSDRKKILFAVSTFVVGVMIILCATAATTTPKAVQPPIPKNCSLAEPRSLQQVGLPVDLTQAAIPDRKSVV